MKFVYFTHSLASCWNHGNAHFLRGVIGELGRRGHDVQVFEPNAGWSVANLLADHGEAGLADYRRTYPHLRSRGFDDTEDVVGECQGADVVLVHEWNEPALVAALGAARRRGGRFRLLFHDTHHRAVSDPEAIRAFDLDGYDAVLAFGEALAEVYRGWGWGRDVHVWHEAADTQVFRPPAVEGERSGLVFIGNWGDGERSRELESYLFGPARDCAMPLDIYGVRYPEDALARLQHHGAAYRGWLANARVPDIFARHLATVHVPRRFYAQALPGIPTIRVFEALACGIPLICAPWQDSEDLFTPGQDYLMARDCASVQRCLRAVRDDAELRRSLAEQGLATIRSRHSCAHRVDELLAILQARQPAPVEEACA